MVTVKKCQSSKDLKEFERVPEKILSQNPYFVPPFPGSISKLLTQKAPFNQLHGEIHPFIAYRDGVTVGRIAAIINRTHNEYYKDSNGFFGFFDSIDDEEVGAALVAAAKAELKRHGLTRMRGPYNPSVNDEVGMLADGFDSAPFVMMPFNPAYYVDLYERLGFEKVRDLYAFYISSELAPPERIKKIADRVKRTTGITIRDLDMKNLDKDIRIIRDLYNVTLDRNFGFVPVTFEELEFAANDLKAILDPTMVLIAEKNGKPVGFSLAIPNINEFLWRAGKGNILKRIVKFVWYLKTRRPKEARLAVLGVKPEFRGKGIETVFYSETLLRGKKFAGGELSWIEETNKEIIHGITVMGAKKYKSYRLYEQPL